VPVSLLDAPSMEDRLWVRLWSLLDEFIVSRLAILLRASTNQSTYLESQKPSSITSSEETIFSTASDIPNESLFKAIKESGTRADSSRAAQLFAILPLIVDPSTRSQEEILRTLLKNARDTSESPSDFPDDSSPAWTSVLGQANYAGVYGVSVDQGAACVVARRALGLRTRVRPYVAHVLSRERGTGHTSSGQPGLKLVAKALPKRRSTWEPSGLCLRRHSAQIPGSRSGIEPHGVMVAARTGDDPGLGSQPAPTVARGHLGSQARQSHAVVPLPPRPVLRTQRARHDPGDQRWSAMSNVGLSGE
jgi:hypothetical protein